MRVSTVPLQPLVDVSLPYTPGSRVSLLPTPQATRAAFPDKMAGRHFHCYRTLRGISVRCISRGHYQHSPSRIATRQLVSRSALYRSTSLLRDGTTGIVSEASFKKITPLNVRITSRSRFYRDSYRKEQGHRSFAARSF